MPKVKSLNSQNEIVVDLKNEHLRNQEEEQDLLYMQTHACPSLEALWDNEKDAEYDKLVVI